MVTRAGVTENIFHDVFGAAEECYFAAYDEGVARLSRAVSEATRREQTWLERVRCGLVALLSFFEDEPPWARLLLLEVPFDAARTILCRQRLHDVLGALLDQDDGLGNADCSSLLLPALTAELVVGGVFSVIRTSMLEADDAGTLVELAPSLMAFIVTPYLGEAAAKAELHGRHSRGGATPASAAARSYRGELARAQAISRAARLPIRATRRTTLVLRAIAQTPYSNNRELAQAAGLNDEGQTSRLLARLEYRGVIQNVGVGAARGEPNAWLLTSSGRRAVELLADPEGRLEAGAGVREE